MKCLKPRVIVRTDVAVPAYAKAYKYVPSFVSSHPDWFMLVPCGHCAACRKAKTRENATKLLYESEQWAKSCFISLDYAPENLPLMAERPEDISYEEYYGTLRQYLYNFGSTLVREAVPDFIKRLREQYFRDNKLRLNIRYFYCGEYGDELGRPHYHIIMFGLDGSDQELLDKVWQLGNVDIGPVNVKTIQYVTGYVRKKLNGKLGKKVYGYRVPPFQGQSHDIVNFDKFPPLVRKQIETRLYQDLSCKIDGHKTAIPRIILKRNEELHDLVQQNVDSSPLLHMLEDPYEFTRDCEQRTVDSVIGAQVHTKHSVF